MVKCAVFDLDGTLLDTVNDLHRTMNILLEKYGFPLIDRKTAICNIGHGALEFVRDSLPENKRHLTGECCAAYRKILNGSDLSGTSVFGGIKELLDRLQAKGVKLAILTNKPQSSADIAVGKFLSGFSFEYVCGQNKNDLPKPDPAALISVIKKAEVSKDEAVMIGDGEADVKVALNAGIKHISVLWGYRTKEQLQGAGAKIFACTPKEVFDLIEKM